MLVSAEEVLDVRGSLLHVIETEAILLQLLRQLSLYQPKGLAFRRFFLACFTVEFFFASWLTDPSLLYPRT